MLRRRSNEGVRLAAAIKRRRAFGWGDLSPRLSCRYKPSSSSTTSLSMSASGTHNVTCNTANCLAPKSSPGRRHDWNYHLVPVPFKLGRSTLCFQLEGGKLVCPFQGCNTSLNRRDRATKHARTHGLDESVKIFEGLVGKHPARLCALLDGRLILHP